MINPLLVWVAALPGHLSMVLISGPFLAPPLLPARTLPPGRSAWFFLAGAINRARPLLVGCHGLPVGGVVSSLFCYGSTCGSSPTISRGHVKQVAGLPLDQPAIIHGRRCPARRAPIPTCSTAPVLAPTERPTRTDHFHPGFSNIRISSGCSNRFSITSHRGSPRSWYSLGMKVRRGHPNCRPLPVMHRLAAPTPIFLVHHRPASATRP